MIINLITTVSGLNSGESAVAVPGELENMFRYQVGDTSLEIEFINDPDDAKFKILSGVVRGIDLDNVEAIVNQKDNFISRTLVNDSGNFTFVLFTSGVYSLEIRGPGAGLFVERLPLPH